MYLEIVSPEATLFAHDVDSVIVPGVDGEFQLLNNHAAIVSLLGQGLIKIKTNSQLAVDDLHTEVVSSTSDKKALTVKINSGTLEMKDNKVIILAD